MVSITNTPVTNIALLVMFIEWGMFGHLLFSDF